MPVMVKIVLGRIIWLLMLVILAGVVISWLRAFRVRVSYYNPLVRAIEGISETMLRPIRRSFPTTGGGLDFAPMIALIVLAILQGIIARL